MDIVGAISKLKNYFMSSAQIGGITKLIPIEIVTSAGAYIANDSIGGSVKVDGAYRGAVFNKSGVIHSIKAQFVTGATVGDIRVHFFNTEVTATDNDAFVPTAAQQKTMIPYTVLLESANKETVNSIDSIHLTGLNIPFQVYGADGLLYMNIMAAAGVTIGTTSGLHITLGILQD